MKSSPDYIITAIAVMETLGFPMKSSPDYIITAIMSGISDQPVNEYNIDAPTQYS